MNRRYFLQPAVSAALILGLLINSGCSDSRYGAERLYWKAEQTAVTLIKQKGRELSAEDYQRMIDEYRKIIFLYPLEAFAAQAHFKISELYVAQKKFEDAQNEMENMIRNFSSNSSLASRGQFAIGKIHEIRGNTDQALEEYDKVSDLYPLTSLGIQMPLYTVQYLDRLGRVDDQEKIYERAIKKYNRLLNDYSGTSVAPVILTVKAQLNLLMKKNDAALKDWDALILEYPQSPEAVNAYLAKADFYERRMNDIRRALDIYTGFISDYARHPLVPDAEARMAWLYLRSGDTKTARNLFEKISTNPDNPDNVCLSALLGLATIARNNGQKEQVLGIYDRIYRDFAGTRIGTAVPFLRAQYLFETGDVRAETALSEAIAHYRSLIESLTASRELRRTASHYLILAFIRNNEHQKALRILQSLAAQYPDNPGYLLDLAGVYAMTEEQDEAIGVYEKLIEKYAGNEYLVSLSRAKIKSLEAMSASPSEDEPVQ